MPLYIAEVSEDDECGMNLKNLRPYEDKSQENFKLLQKIKKLEMEKENLRLEVAKEKSKNRTLRDENVAQQGEITARAPPPASCLCAMTSPEVAPRSSSSLRPADLLLYRHVVLVVEIELVIVLDAV